MKTPRRFQAGFERWFQLLELGPLRPGLGQVLRGVLRGNRAVEWCKARPTPGALKAPLCFKISNANEGEFCFRVETRFFSESFARHYDVKARPLALKAPWFQNFKHNEGEFCFRIEPGFFLESFVRHYCAAEQSYITECV